MLPRISRVLLQEPLTIALTLDVPLDNLRRKDLLRRLRNDRATCWLRRLFRLGLRRFCLYIQSEHEGFHHTRFVIAEDFFPDLTRKVFCHSSTVSSQIFD